MKRISNSPRLMLLIAFIVAQQAARGQDSRSQSAEVQQAASMAEYERTVAPFLARYCSECHGPQKPEKELELRKLEPDMKASTSAARWATVLEQLRSGEMPPQEKSRPDDTALQAV